MLPNLSFLQTEIAHPAGNHPGGAHRHTYHPHHPHHPHQQHQQHQQHHNAHHYTHPHGPSSFHHASSGSHNAPHRGGHSGRQGHHGSHGSHGSHHAPHSTVLNHRYSDYTLSRDDARRLLSTLQRHVLRQRLPATEYRNILRYLTEGNNDDMQQRQAAHYLAQLLPPGLRPQTREQSGYTQAGSHEPYGGGYILESYLSGLHTVAEQHRPR